MRYGVLFILAGCNMTPMPPVLREVPIQVLDQAKNEALAEASCLADGWLAEEWWHLFRDPQLDELVSRALAQNPSIDSAEARIAGAIANKNKAAAPLFPSLSFEADLTKVHQSRNGIFGILAESDPSYPLTYRQKDLTLSFGYQFDFMRKFRNQLIAALNEVQALKAEAYLARFSLAVAVSKFYFEWLVTQNRLAFARQLVENRQKIVNLMKQRHAQGIESGIAINRALNHVLTAEQYRAQIVLDAALSRNELQALIAEDFTTPLEQTEVTGMLEPFPLPNSLPLDLLAHRPDVWALRWRVEAAAREICVAKAEFYPNIDLNGYLGLQALGSLAINSWDSVAGLLIGPALHLPLFNGGALQANYDYRCQEFHLAVAEYDSAVLTATKEVLSALLVLKHADENYRSAIEAEKLAKNNIELSQLQIRQKLHSRIDLLSFENDWLQAGDSRIQAFQHCLQARLDLIRALGGGFGICSGNSS